MDKLKQKFIENKLFYSTVVLIGLLGMLLRCFALFSNPSLWYDEASIALNLDKNVFLPPLLNNQSAPFLFLILTKICSIISSSNFSLRLIPFVSGLFSIPVFFIFVKEQIKSKLGQILALLIFCINFRLIYFSKELKPYSLDVLIFMLAIICYFKIDFKNLPPKICALIGLIYGALPLLSFSSLFILPVCYLFTIFQNGLNNFKNKFAFILPALILAPFYYFLFLKGYSGNEYLQRFWTTGFITPDTFLPSFINLFNFFLEPSNLNILILISILAGLIMLLVQKNKVAIFSLSAVFFVILASFLHKYPMQERLSLFLLPVALVFAFKIFDVSKKKLFISVLVFLLGWNFYLRADLPYVFNPDFYEREAITGLLKTLKHEYRNDEFIFPLPWSDVAFLHYNKFYKFPSHNLIVFKENYSDNYTKPFQNLPKGKYWLIFTIQSDNYKRYLSLQDWLKNDFKIIKIYKEQSSRMYYAEKIK